VDGLSLNYGKVKTLQRRPLIGFPDFRYENVAITVIVKLCRHKVVYHNSLGRGASWFRQVRHVARLDKTTPAPEAL